MKITIDMRTARHTIKDLCRVYNRRVRQYNEMEGSDYQKRNTEAASWLDLHGHMEFLESLGLVQRDPKLTTRFILA